MNSPAVSGRPSKDAESGKLLRETQDNSPSTSRVTLDEQTANLGVEERDLRVTVANEVLKLFRWSLIGTLTGAGAILLADLLFIGTQIIRPAERLMTENVLMALIGATVVQVGAALAAIVFAIFKDKNKSGD